LVKDEKPGYLESLQRWERLPESVKDDFSPEKYKHKKPLLFSGAVNR
jgi:hypothetical protein